MSVNPVGDRYRVAEGHDGMGHGAVPSLEFVWIFFSRHFDAFIS